MPQMKLFGNSRSAARVAGRRKAEPENEPKEKKQKKKKPLKVLAIWLTVILCLEGLYFFLCYTQNSFVKRWRTIYIQTAMSTMRHQWMATYLLPGRGRRRQGKLLGLQTWDAFARRACTAGSETSRYRGY